MSSPAFVHLKLHTEFSLSDSTIRIKSLCKDVAEAGMPAVAVTDMMNLFALVKFYKAANAGGIKPVLGADLRVEVAPDADAGFVVTALIMNETGYANLTELISRAYLSNQRLGKAYIKREWLAEKNDGLILLSGGLYGDVGQALSAGNRHKAEALLADWQRDFPSRFYLELHRTGREGEEDYLHQAVDLALASGCPVVATNDVRFSRPEDFEAHEARVCIAEGYVLDDPKRPRHYSEQQYLKTAEEMTELFSDIPEALENTVEIAKRCTCEIRLGENFLPDFPFKEKDELGARSETIEEYFVALSRQRLDERLATILDSDAPDYQERYREYHDRLDFELGIINKMGFPGYFLIVADFIEWSKNNNIPVGPGRGSGAGSLVAYALKITDLDPLQYDLLFERFLNPERVSMPDFDVDFCMDKRDEVIRYVKEQYGEECVSQIITFGTMAARAVVRDVARVQGKPYGLADRMSKLIPGTPGMTLQAAYEQEDMLREFLESDGDAEAAQEIWEMALKLEGLTRNVGKHAGGVVIAPGKLTDFSALYCDETGENLVTQFDKDDVEQAGLVKFDFLGLRTLTIIDWAVQMVNARLEKSGEEPVDITRIPLDDPAVYELLKNAETTAVFQLESSGMKELIKRLRPDVFEDIIALVALFRPGPLQSGMVDDFIDRKHGRQELAFPHPDYQLPSLQPVLQPTYGIILYQEQVMQIAQVMAGYSLGGADMLRRAMGKKKPEEMEKQKAAFMEGSVNNQIDPTLSEKIFDLVEKFAGYGFNKSHSAAYALVSYQTAWLKCHYPAEFMAAVLSSDMDNTDKVVTLIDECHRMQLSITPPDVNSCQRQFSVNEQGEIVFGLGAIKGLGHGPIESIVAGRQDGPYKDLFDFCRRVDLRKVNRRALEALVRSGALDGLGPNCSFHDRATLMANLDDAIAAAEQEAQNQAAGMGDLFGGLGDEPEQSQSWRNVRSWSEEQRLAGEKETLGLYLTGHPIDQFESELAHFISSRIVDLQPTERGRQSVVAGLIIQLRIVKTKTGRKIAIATLDDKSGRVEASFFSEVFEEHRNSLQKDNLVVVEGDVGHDHFTGGLKVTAKKLMSIDEARRNYARELRLLVRESVIGRGIGQTLRDTLHPFLENGQCRVSLTYRRKDAQGVVHLGPEWKVQPDRELIDQLSEQLGKQAVEIRY